LGTIVDEGGVVRGCQGALVPAEPVGADFYIMLDRSLSMSCSTPTSSDRWGAVEAGFAAAFASPAANVGVGLQYFGDATSSSCNSSVYESPDVEIGPLSKNSSALLASLGAHMPLSNTPTAAALAGALNHAIEWKNTHPERVTAVVLVTDGEPNACGAVSNVVDAASSGLASQIATYVLGIISSSGSACAVDPNPANKADLDAIAAAGGTKMTRLFDVAKDGAAAFAQLVAGIASDARPSCRYAVPSSASPVDPNKVNVQYTPAGTSKPITIPCVTQATCTSSAGWFFDNPAAPQEVILCPDTCVAVGAAPLTFDLGCATVHPR
jgi:hypothetical protein